MDRIYRKINTYSNISLILFILSLFDITLVIKNPSNVKLLFLINIVIILLPFLSLFVVKHNIKKTNNPALLKGSKILTTITVIKVLIVIIYVVLGLLVFHFQKIVMSEEHQKWLAFAVNITLNFICVIMYICAMAIIKHEVKKNI